jgi:hypothetical protein
VGNREILEKNLAETERDITRAEERLRRQRKIVDDLERAGRSEAAAEARLFLATLAKSQAIDLGTRERLRRALRSLPPQ